MIIYIFYDSRYESEIKKKREEREMKKARSRVRGEKQENIWEEKKIVNQFDFLIFNLKSFTV
jgi:hypothetical protein